MTTPALIACAAALILLVVLLAAINRRLGGALSVHGFKIRRARRLRRRLIREDLSPASAIAYLRKVDPYVFEELVLLSFREAGYRITRNRRYSGDGGIDGRIAKGGQRWFVQCKRYKGYISSRQVAEFAAVCQEGRRRGVFVHTGRTGGASREMFAYDDDIEVVSGARLCRLILQGEDVLS